MKYLLSIALAAQGALAFPSVMHMLAERSHKVAKGGCTTSKRCDKPYDVSDADIDYDPNNPTAAQTISAARTNCGAQGPCLLFNSGQQYVSTSGAHAYKDPGPSDIRGPCPGLNAAANHGYLPRDGVANIQQTVLGLQALYGMGPDLGGFLAAYAIGIDGDPITMTWSIGGPPQSFLNLPGIVGKPQGISYSHNKYEGDSSIGRCDAFLNGGDAHSLSLTRFKYAYEAGQPSDRYTLDKFSQAFTKNAIRSEMTNPLYFAPLFSTTLVSPAAYNFVINFMSNHTQEEPSGYLDGNMFKQFFGVTGEYPNFKWIKGKERVPDNWYKRTPTNEYAAVQGVFGDLAPEFAAYPKSFRFGGNLNGKNTYKGVDINNLTNGAFTPEDLQDPKNLACFFYQFEQQFVPDAFESKAAKVLLGSLESTFGGLGCGKVGKFRDNALSKYPGRNYHPKGKATSC